MVPRGPYKPQLAQPHTLTGWAPPIQLDTWGMAPGFDKTHAKQEHTQRANQNRRGSGTRVPVTRGSW